MSNPRALGKRIRRRIRRTLFLWFYDRKAENLTRRWSSEYEDTPEYLRYVGVQIERTRLKEATDARHRLIPAVKLVQKHCPDLGGQSRILCLGPRSEVELELLNEIGFETPVGLDLWPTSRRIVGGDMHAMPFEDRSFDLLFASHVFEHSYDFARVAAECLRVLNPGGYIFFEVPQKFQPNEHDRVSFDGISGILKGFADSSVDVLFEESGIDGQGQDFLRGILKSRDSVDA